MGCPSVADVEPNNIALDHRAVDVDGGAFFQCVDDGSVNGGLAPYIGVKGRGGYVLAQEIGCHF